MLVSLSIVREAGFRFAHFISQLFSPQDELEREVEKSKTVNLELVFGYHWKPGTGNRVSLLSNTPTACINTVCSCEQLTNLMAASVNTHVNVG